MPVPPLGAADQGGGRRLQAALAVVVACAALSIIVGPTGAAAAMSATPAPPTPVPTSPDQMGPPQWLPLRHDLDGGEMKVGCTFESHGSPFGYECAGHHDRWALDLIATRGTPVYAAGRGWAVDLSGKAGGNGYGNVVQVDHGNGMTTLYGHLSKILVPAGGAWVTENTVIGLVGSTGTSSAPHLHFEKRSTLFDAAVDPGPLMACRAGYLVRYPEVAKQETWRGLPWGAITVVSDGTDCATPDGTQKLPPNRAPGDRSGTGAGRPDASPSDPWLRLVESSDLWRRALAAALAPVA